MNPVRLWLPSQNGLLADCPQRHSLIAVRPASPKAVPAGSRISKSPSIRIGPLFMHVIFVGIFREDSRAYRPPNPNAITSAPDATATY